MSDTSKGMVKYTSRDYQSIMDDFWNMVPKLTDLWNPEADADPGVVLGKYLASVADMLGINLDWDTNEIYAPSVTQRKNAEKLFWLIGYNLGWYTAARTEVTITNKSDSTMKIDFGFNGANFSTLNAYTDITGQSRVITYNLLPRTDAYGSKKSRSTRETTAGDVNPFVTSDIVTLKAGEKCTRVAIEGELRNTTVSVASIKENNYIIKLPSQHIDTTAVWIKAKSSLSQESYLATQWKQVDSTIEFSTPEPRFAVTYDNYSNAQVTISNYLNQLDNYENNYLVIYWIECSGVIGCVNKNVLSNLLIANTSTSTYDVDNLTISNLSNTLELPNTYTITGKSPETAKEAYANSRNYINTWDSLITLPDFQRFLNREPGIDCGLVLDCQKALEINLAIYKDTSLTDSQKSKMYINYTDFPESDKNIYNWRNILDLGFDPTDESDFKFAANFTTYKAMCYAIHNDFQPSSYGENNYYADNKIQTEDKINYIQYKPPVAFINGVYNDYAPLQAMSVELGFGYARIFPWYVVGEIYPKNPITSGTATALVAKVKEALALYFSPANRSFGQKPTIMEVVTVVEGADDSIRYFDAGSINNNVINWGERRTSGTKSWITEFDVEYFNPISFARYQDLGSTAGNIRVNPEWISD